MLKNPLYMVPVFLGLLSLSTLAVAQIGGHIGGQTITHIKIQRIQDQDCRKAAVTFGQPFVKGDVPKGAQLYARLDGRRLPTQVNVKATNDDGSVRHAIITVLAPCSVGSSGASVALVTGTASPMASKPPVSLGDVLHTSYDTRISLKLGGRKWHLDARSLLRQVKRAGGCQNAEIFFCKRWLKGPLASVWVVGAPLKGPNGAEHPHLAAYFAVRAFGPAPVKRIRTDVVVGNDWAYVKHPRNYHYQPTITVSDRSKPAYQPKAFTHYRQARWHHRVWWGKSRQAPLYARLNSEYLQSTPAAPNYASGHLASGLIEHARHNQICPPMKHCGQTKTMTNTGAQAAIGPLPRWGAAYVIHPGYAVFRWMLANSDALGAYGIHYRQRDDGKILSIRQHPCATLNGAAEVAPCPVPPHGDDRFPDCHEKCHTPLIANIAHHPAPAYMAYVATGDWFYKNEMAFVAMWNLFWQNPAYRGYKKGFVHQTQLRGQAWMLRTLGYTAYILPDDSPKKQYLNNVVERNIAWYNKHYVENTEANNLGGMYSWHAVIYSMHGHERVGIAPWQQSFMTWAVGNLVDLGFAHAAEFRDWISQFQVGLMTAPGYCWQMASAYAVQVRKTRHSPYFTRFKEIYDHTFPKLKDVGCKPERLSTALAKREWNRHRKWQAHDYPPGTMIGYPKSPTGFVANFQIGLAAAANADIPNAVRAWNIFATRSVQPNYSSSPQFAVVPTRSRQ